MYSVREKKTPKKQQKAHQQATVVDDDDDVIGMRAKKGRRNRQFHDESDQFFREHLGERASGDGAASSSLSSLPQRGVGSLASISESMFVQWEELLAGRELLKRRLDAIGAVHGWEATSSRKGFLGGIEPGALIKSIREEIATLEPAAEGLEKADLLLELRAVREQLSTLSDERQQLAEDVAQLREADYDNQAVLESQDAELERLRKLTSELDGVDAPSGGAAGVGAARGSGGGTHGGAGQQSLGSAATSAAVDLEVFQTSLSRDQTADGRRVVEVSARMDTPPHTPRMPRHPHRRAVAMRMG